MEEKLLSEQTLESEHAVANVLFEVERSAPFLQALALSTFAQVRLQHAQTEAERETAFAALDIAQGILIDAVAEVGYTLKDGD